ncbi:MAG: M48 family metallopeptidase [Chloroflexota bacterium]|jgi:heat shock protein HtpX
MTLVRETFHQQIRQNKTRSLLLMAAVVVVFAVLAWFIGFALAGDPANAIFFVPIGGIIALVIALGAFFGGDGMILGVSRAREVSETDEPQLVNVVRELSLAANLPEPKVYVMEDPALNAFATGRDPEHASVAVTRGLLERLDREELQGVVGHELAHVANYDIRFSLLVGVLVGSIALMADILARMTFWGSMGRGRGGGRGGGGAQIFLLALGLLVAILAPLFARLVQMAVNRQREYLADATSVELTRNPYGLERALAKLGADTLKLEGANKATQHLYFVNPVKKLDHSARGLFSTHPAIVDRINRLRKLTGQPEIDESGIAGIAGLR